MKQLKKRILSFGLIICLVAGIFVPMKSMAANGKSPYYVTVNRKHNVVTIYKMDKKGNYTVPVKAMTCSVGMDGRTPKGTFSIYAKYRWRPLFYGVYGQYACRINGPILFHSVTYTKQDPSKLQYEEYNKLGTAASHGCIRLTVEDSRWIYKNCPNGTKVKVFDGKNVGPLGKPKVQKLDPNSKLRGWDPTDQDKKNPWHKVVPVITSKKTITMERQSTKNSLLKQVKAKDYAGKSVKVTITGKYNLNKCGTYSISFVAKDNRGKQTKKSVKLIIKDTIKPTIGLSGDVVNLSDEIVAEKEAEYGEWSEWLKAQIQEQIIITDRKDKLSADHAIFDLSEIKEAVQQKEYGTYEVKIYAIDDYNNKSKSVSFTIYYLQAEEN